MEQEFTGAWKSTPIIPATVLHRLAFIWLDFAHDATNFGTMMALDRIDTFCQLICGIPGWEQILQRAREDLKNNPPPNAVSDHIRILTGEVALGDLKRQQGFGKLNEVVQEVKTLHEGFGLILAGREFPPWDKRQAFHFVMSRFRQSSNSTLETLARAYHIFTNISQRGDGGGLNRGQITIATLCRCIWGPQLWSESLSDARPDPQVKIEDTTEIHDNGSSERYMEVAIGLMNAAKEDIGKIDPEMLSALDWDETTAQEWLT